MHVRSPAIFILCESFVKTPTTCKMWACKMQIVLELFSTYVADIIEMCSLVKCVSNVNMLVYPWPLNTFLGFECNVLCYSV